MSRALKRILVAVPLLWNVDSFAFDVHTHVALTMEAAAKSRISPNASDSALASLGLFDVSIWTEKEYIDLSLSTLVRNSNSIQESVIRTLALSDAMTSAVPAPYTITGWIMQGAVREDDNATETPSSDEPGGVFPRVFGHFFDPQNNRGLSIGSVSLGPRAVDWALGASAEIGGRKNHFKVSDAREAMWRALTLTGKDPSGGFSATVWPSNWGNGSQEALRRAYWATTFRALGDVVHLLQDAAQPQHTRNDFHSGLYCVPGLGCAGGHASFFEQYLRARTLQTGRFSLDEGFVGTGEGAIRKTSADQLTYDGYQNPTFNSYSDYFSTGELSSNAAGYGLANYSNRGFYTFGTNIYSPEALAFYPLPPPTGAGLAEVVIASGLTDMTGQALPGRQSFFLGTVHDSLDPASDAQGVRLSSYGLWDQFLSQKSFFRRHTLNYRNYDDQAALLIPRAVAYSAGILDYFFRGRMQISLPDIGLYAIVDHADFAGAGVPATDVNGYRGFGKIRLKLSNTTPSITTPSGTYSQDMGAGTLVAVAKFHRNLCYQDDLSGQDYFGSTCRSDAEEIVLSRFQSVASVPTTPKEYEFIFDQEIPINAEDLYLQVVFRGPLGQEADAVVVATHDLSEPTYIGFINTSEYLKIGQRAYTHEQVSTSQELRNQVRPTYCILNNQLQDSCFVPNGSLNAIWHFYRDPSANQDGIEVRINAMPVARFSRIAVLVDADPGTQDIYMRLVGDPPFPWTFGSDMTQWNYSSAGSVTKMYAPVVSARQTHQTNFFPFLLVADGLSIYNTENIPPSDLALPLDDPRPLSVESITIPQMTP